jgi:hypothetical protein
MPSLSPDLNPLDFYLWGHLKALMYAACIEKGNALLHCIVDVSTSSLNLVEDMLNTYYTCTISDITHKLSVSIHMLIWIFYLLICGTRAFQSQPVYIL